MLVDCVRVTLWLRRNRPHAIHKCAQSVAAPACRDRVSVSGCRVGILTHRDSQVARRAPSGAIRGPGWRNRKMHVVTCEPHPAVCGTRGTERTASWRACASAPSSRAPIDHARGAMINARTGQITHREVTRPPTVLKCFERELLLALREVVLAPRATVLSVG